MTVLRSELPPLPDRMKQLKIDSRGYPVPWFVAWLSEKPAEGVEPKEVTPGEGYPEFRVLRRRAVREALQFDQCWICGGQMGRYKAFVIGPMCMVNLVNSEPPSHIDCADFAARACPFLSRPSMVRREGNLPAGGEMPGVASLRNPGVAVVWVTDRGFPIKRVPNGILFDLPDPSEVRIYCKGRPATREEVRESLDSGLPTLLGVCGSEGERNDVRARLEASKAHWPAA